MILSSAPEFVPWIIQPNKKPSFSKANKPGKVQSIGEHRERIPSADEASEESSLGEDSDIYASNEADNPEDLNEVDLIEEEVIDPNLLPKFTPAQYKEHGEAEYLRGYNACKENENLEFGDRLEQLNNLIEALKNERVDISEFYDPLRELVVSAIESIMQIELVESKKSISKIVSTILEEISIEADDSIRLFLNPSDASLLKNQKSPNDSPIKVLSDPRLAAGSARAVMGDAVIENMKENRVSHIVDQILGENQGKAAKSSRKK
tara:strand:- start:1960 stop:2751 length:792 start_codon:yes stop_codon:yes gene_type:complete